ncbi:MAG: ribonuclease HII [Bradyrhizobium sp.]|nr:MAG: ribonuclease HII [Bradyrhizobium sp.]
MGAPHFDFERALIADGRRYVVGVDEVGRGPLAGPVGVGAVILDPDDLPEGLDDSKALSASRREALAEIIYVKALAVTIVFGSVEEIDAYNIRGATLRAMARAVHALSLRADYALIDGRDIPPGLRCQSRAIVKGDGQSLSIAAASIVAKVARDALMIRLDAVHPGYGFARHAGYGTRAHIAALARLGPCSLHRRSFKPKGLFDGERSVSAGDAEPFQNR